VGAAAFWGLTFRPGRDRALAATAAHTTGAAVITVPVATMLVLGSLFAIEIGWLARC
jgi:hypothetical protein